MSSHLTLPSFPTLFHYLPGNLTIRAFLVDSESSSGKTNNNRNELKNFNLHGKKDGGNNVLVCQQSGYLELSVMDSGAGMTEQQLADLFKAGVQFTVNQLQAGKGSGLGLYITKGIVEQHDGTVSAKPDGLDKGSTFILKLPLYHVPERFVVANSKARAASSLSEHQWSTTTDKESIDTAATSEAAEDAFSSLRILVVDDAKSNRKLLSRLLEKRGHDCDQVEDGRDAVEATMVAIKASKPYHTILMDYEMEFMNGPDAALEMRRLGCDSFIVGITGNLLQEDVQHFKDCGANNVLSKPFMLNELEMLWVEYGLVGGGSARSSY